MEKENTHVHQVYDKIASHFSNTRYKPWPQVSKYLNALPKGSIGADIGCGNGKYFTCSPNIVIGSDRSVELIKIALRRSVSTYSDAFVCDMLNMPYRNASLDFAISIAAIHHISTQDRRVQAIKNILAVLAPHGTALLYVWAKEQTNKKIQPENPDDLDVMVPWTTPDGTTYSRYYHLYREGDINIEIKLAGGKLIESGYERDNHWAVITHAV
ncbi:hypothetical protein CANCADRAFT_3010 [Tortispora caseinolytica NRRL Y-17796]|uniref:Methyltransferase type 11 domain-containing protein n=1 Tax=Tortispora caseinolytica NRRL Y-17796 TaxID=767744 RepID=A0A1E4THT3_9ASCO|nr:hypothetical protein CANCADRAFT_3010 [Tortispora caseinolytica NRRL Y-17796]